MVVSLQNIIKYGMNTRNRTLKALNGLKGQQSHSPRHRLGYECSIYVRPVRAEVFDDMAFALAGRCSSYAHKPRALPWAMSKLSLRDAFFGGTMAYHLTIIFFNHELRELHEFRRKRRGCRLANHLAASFSRLGNRLRYC